VVEAESYDEEALWTASDAAEYVKSFFLFSWDFDFGVLGGFANVELSYRGGVRCFPVNTEFNEKKMAVG
jgi:hypothetical protein